MNRSFLKWAGGKYKLLGELLPLFPEGERFVEPFVGAGVVFANVNYPSYFINDSNRDLMNVYDCLQSDVEKFIVDLREVFDLTGNNEENYIDLRDHFNDRQLSSPWMKSLFFIYLNRHCFNGLCRYNKNGKFNVPFGKYKTIYFPERELRYIGNKIKDSRVEFWATDYSTVFDYVKSGDIVYCDPPYIPLSKTSNFTQYGGQKFEERHQKHLAILAETSVSRGAIVLISNHDTEFAREIYRNARIVELEAGRSISADGNKRKPVREVVAIYGG